LLSGRSAKRLVVGVGNPDAGDDGAGRAVARRLAARPRAGVVVRECTGDAAGLIEAWQGFDDVVVVDACHGAGPPGRVHRLHPDDLAGFKGLGSTSTHSFGVEAAVGLARALGTLPRRLVIHAIEGCDFEPGARLSAAVRHGVDAEVLSLSSPR
jgi:hydrogenase maturation protease